MAILSTSGWVRGSALACAIMTNGMVLLSVGVVPVAYGQEVATPVKKRRTPPPPVIPTEETLAAQREYQAGRYKEAVEAAKGALNKNERYTPAMLIMAKSFFKLKKYEWVKTLWETMQKNDASSAEQAEVFHLLAFMELEKDNIPGAIAQFKKSVAARSDNALVWNNLGAMYLTAKNYREAVPALERTTQLQPTFAKGYLNLGSAYRGVKDYARAETAYNRALQLFSNYADAVFNLGILYLDADSMPDMDVMAQQNKATSFFQRYKQMMGGRLAKSDPVEQYIVEAQDKISKEEKRLEREQKRVERDAKRNTQKTPTEAEEKAQPKAPTP